MSQINELQFSGGFANLILNFLTKHLPSTCIILGFIVRIILLSIVIQNEYYTYSKISMFYFVCSVLLMLAADIAFMAFSVLTAKFYALNSSYWKVFLVLTIIGVFILGFEIFEFVELKKFEGVSYWKAFFKLQIMNLIAVLLSDGGAVLLYGVGGNLDENNRNSETSETRNSEIEPKQTENDVSQESEESTQGKIEDLALPNKISKAGEGKFSVNEELPKDLDGFKGNMRTHRSKKNKFLEKGEYRSAKKSEVWEDYYSAIVAIIEEREKEGSKSWTEYPNGSLAVESQPKNGHKLEPEFYK